MKRFLAVILSVVMSLSMSVTALAAEELGSVDFNERVSSKSQIVTKTVKGRKGAVYKITGLYHPSEGKEVLKIMNRERKAAGLPALEWEERLVQPAIQRALEMYVLVSHTRPDGSECFTVSNFLNGENLAGGDTNAEDVMDGWMNSPDHRDNILEPAFTSAAVVCVETDKQIFWVQLFHQGKKSESSTAKDSESDKSESEAESKPSAGGVTPKSIQASLDKAYSSTDSTTSITLKGVSSLSTDALKAANDWGSAKKRAVWISTTTLTSSGKSTQGQLSLNPANFKNNKNGIKTGVYVDKASVSSVADEFKGSAVIKLEQSGSYGGTVSIGAKADLKGLNTKSLLFYHYDVKTGKITRMDLSKTGGYTIDNNKYLRFATSKGGYIIVTDKALA